MSSPRSAGRIVGALTLVQLSVNATVSLALVGPLFRPPGILANAAAHASRLALAIVLALIVAGIGLAIAVIVQQAVARRAPAWGHGLLGLAAASLALSAVEQTQLADLLSLSKTYSTADAAGRAAFDAVKATLAGSRQWPHYFTLIAAGCMLVVLYAALLRASLVPRALALFGIVAAAIHVGAVAMPLFGRNVALALLAPLALSQLALSLWLMAKGFTDSPMPINGDAP